MQALDQLGKHVNAPSISKIPLPAKSVEEDDGETHLVSDLGALRRAGADPFFCRPSGSTLLYFKRGFLLSLRVHRREAGI
jgi:hypothetical protein